MVSPNSPSESAVAPSTFKEANPLSLEAKNRVDTISSIINNIIQESADGERVVLKSFNENLRRQIRTNPGDVAAALNSVEENYQASLENKTGAEKYQASKDHTAYLEKTCGLINACAQNTKWDDEFKALAGNYNDKRVSLLSTYGNIITNIHSTPITQTA